MTSLAAFRDQRSGQLRKLAEEHMKHDLNQSDRDILRSAGGKIGTHAQIGSLLGLGLGIYCAVRLRSMRMATFNAFRTLEKPVEVRFADGRTAPVPDITKDLAPSKWSDAATFFFFSVGGLFLGGETGFLTGTASASRAIAADPGARSRIEKAFRNYQIDAMKQQVNILESQSVPDPLFS